MRSLSWKCWSWQSIQKMALSKLAGESKACPSTPFWSSSTRKTRATSTGETYCDSLSKPCSVLIFVFLIIIIFCSERMMHSPPSMLALMDEYTGIKLKRWGLLATKSFQNIIVFYIFFSLNRIIIIQNHFLLFSKKVSVKIYFSITLLFKSLVSAFVLFFVNKNEPSLAGTLMDISECFPSLWADKSCIFQIYFSKLMGIRSQKAGTVLFKALCEKPGKRCEWGFRDNSSRPHLNSVCLFILI